MTRSLAVELATGNVLVNAVAPGFIATDMTYQNNSPGQLAALTKGLPIGRTGDPEEIAEVVAFFASSRNSFTTGQVLVCDGGYIVPVGDHLTATDPRNVFSVRSHVRDYEVEFDAGTDWVQRLVDL